MAVTPTTLQGRRMANLSIATSPFPRSLSPSPLAFTLDSKSSLLSASSKTRFSWLPPRSDNTALPSPMAKAERESRCYRPQKCLDSFTFKPIVLTLVMFLFVLISIRSDFCSQLMPDTVPLPVTVSSIELPSSPGPVIFRDSHGNLRWTVYIPDDSPFPLFTSQYRAIYDTSQQFSTKSTISTKFRKIYSKFSSTTAPNNAFMDVQDAKDAGILPPSKPAPHNTSGTLPTISHNATQTCYSSLTFVMGPKDIRFGKTLLFLWLAYGLAHTEGRSFFIDDSRWPYGRIADYFEPPSAPACDLPPPSHIISHPQRARHLVASTTTLSWTLGDMHKSDREQTRRIFGLLRRGYLDLFKLTRENKQIVNERSYDLHMEAHRAGDSPIVGVHIRRGDLHPLEWIYSRDYLPHERYSEAVLDILKQHRLTHGEALDRSFKDQIPVLLASDDPDTIVNTDFVAPLLEQNLSVQLAQSNIILASQRSLEHSQPIRQGYYVKHVDENSGWEGGFFASLFNGLGRAALGGLDEDDLTQDQGISSLKKLIGRAYLLDLAVLSQADDVVCAVSSATCRALGVMMGWDKVSQGRWVNVDGGSGWTF